jgi:hypothetical protein
MIYIYVVWCFATTFFCPCCYKDINGIKYTMSKVDKIDVGIDKSHLDKKYFVDRHVYNCPFCRRNNVSYTIEMTASFDWTESKKCFVSFVKCGSCSKKSMHLSYSELARYIPGPFSEFKFTSDDIDDQLLFSIPTSFFTIDPRIPREIRDLISEAEGSLKGNFLTGASACVRKAIYELTIKEDCTGESYEDKIKFLKNKYRNIPSEYFDILSHIQGMTSDKVHEQSWKKWNSQTIKLLLETLREILNEIYVLPEERKGRHSAILSIREELEKSKKQGSPPISDLLENKQLPDSSGGLPE